MLKVARRRFLGMTAAFAAVIAFGGLADLMPNKALVRPPGAIQEDEFIERCIRCGACAHACPVNGISFAHLEDGLRNVGTPVLATPGGYCIVYKGLENPSPQKSAAWKTNVRAHGNEKPCFVCTTTCPTGALQLIDVKTLKLGTAVVIKDTCRAWKYDSCTFPCQDVCQFNAISITAGPEVDETKCVGCNQCSNVCIARQTGPTGIVVEPITV